MGSSNTRKIQDSIDFAAFYLGRRPLAIGGANGMEPALTAANIVQQTILAPPFKFPWNRATFSFTQPATDTPQAIADFGFIEKAYVTDSQNVVTEIPNIKLELTLDAGSGRPTAIGVFLDDNNGNITFRFMPGVPDDPANQITVIYQKRAPTLSAIKSTWSIPNCFSHVYDYGFTALMQLFADDPRFGTFNSKFIGSLLAVSEGLSEQDKAIFMEQWSYVLAASTYAGNKATQGYAGRGQ
ncbi:MAG: hypothetical protein JWQ87_5453 [Candidatus Sulfotelmatobacter sp.]|nr:hypothetical protein [Candidatus Sulfotelmatobacter sp.]